MSKMIDAFNQTAQPAPKPAPTVKSEKKRKEHVRMKSDVFATIVANKTMRPIDLQRKLKNYSYTTVYRWKKVAEKKPLKYRMF